MKFIFCFLILINISTYSQENSDPFTGNNFPVNVGIIEFLNDNPGTNNFTSAFSLALVNNPSSQQRFNIFPYSTLEALKGTIGIKNLTDLNEKVLITLKNKLAIEYICTGVILDSLKVSFRIIRNSDGKLFYNMIFTGGNKEEIIVKILNLLIKGEVVTSSEMILVEGGIFNMGYFNEDLSPIDSAHIDPDEIPVHEVTIKSFYMDKYEVTVGEYKKFCEERKKKMPEPPEWGWIDTHPIVNVSWEDAKAYAQWKGKRLPTEKEWEFAARGGNKSESYVYSGSNNFNDIAWFYPNSSKTTNPCGKKKPNELGIYDLSGNVWEWCEDVYLSYDPKQVIQIKEQYNSKVIRGGSFRDGQRNLRVSNRSKYFQLSKADDLGFRCVKDAEK